MSTENTKRTLGIISKVIAGIIMAATLFMVVFTIISTLVFDRNDRNLFGIRFYIVLSDSMSLSENNKDDKVHFDAGDIVLVKNVDDKAGLAKDDILSFISQNSKNFGETVTHKIRERRETEDGRLIGYVTYGTNTGDNDEVLVEPEYVLGKYVGKLPNVGTFFNFLKTTTGYITCILVPFILVILYQGVNTVRLFKKYKKEQMADLVAEREQIEKEREQSAAMMRELLALKEQLNKQNNPQNPTEQPPVTEAVQPTAPTDTNEQN